MQVKHDKQNMYEMWLLLRRLADAELATLTAWRDVQAWCSQRDYNLVPDECTDDWLNIATQPILALKWLSTLFPNTDDSKPEYWTTWEQGVVQAVVEHIARTSNILLMPPTR